MHNPDSQPGQPDSRYTRVVILETLGQGRVGLTSCRDCGSALVLPAPGSVPSLDAIPVHNHFHAELGSLVV